MSLRDITAQIESHEFAAYVNVASNLETFLYAVMDQNATQKLRSGLDGPENQVEILWRVFCLCRQSIDPRYAHPWDTPLAVYVWLLRQKESPLTKFLLKK